MHLGCPVRYTQAAERFICPCHGGVYDFRGQVVGGPPVRPLDRFYTRLRNGQVQIGPRYSVNSELHRFSPRDPGEPLDGIGQYLYPARFSTPEAPDATSTARDAAPPRERSSRKPKRPGEGRTATVKLACRLEAGHHRRRLDRRAHVAVRRPALAPVPQGPEGDQLVLHAGLGDDVRVPRRRRSPACSWRCTTTRRRRGAYESIRYITNDVFLGEFVRGMHKWGASVMVILIFLHMARMFFFGAYKYPRELNWVIGVVLLILTMADGASPATCCRSTSAPTGRRSSA